MARVLLRDDKDEPIAVACTGCGRLTVNTTTETCAACTDYRAIPETRR